MSPWCNQIDALDDFEATITLVEVSDFDDGSVGHAGELSVGYRRSLTLQGKKRNALNGLNPGRDPLVEIGAFIKVRQASKAKRVFVGFGKLRDGVLECLVQVFDAVVLGR